MKAETFLNRLECLDDLIENKMEELKQWESLAIGTGAMSDGERVQTSTTGDKMSNAVIQCIETKKMIEILSEEKKRKISVLESLETRYYNLLHKVYVQHMTLTEAYRRCGISKKTGSNLHKAAKESLQKKLDERNQK